MPGKDDILLPPKQAASLRAMIPKTAKGSAAEVAQQAAKVAQLRAQKATATHPVAVQQIDRALGKEIQRLASSVGTTQKKVRRQLSGQPANTVALSEDSVESIKQDLREKKEQIAQELQAAPYGTQQATMAALEALRIDKREKLLAKGLDIKHAPRPDMRAVTEFREPLSLPKKFVAPRPATRAVMTRVLVASIPRSPSESDEKFKQKTLAYAERAMVRLLNKTAEKGKDDVDLAVEAAKETAQKDKKAIEDEFAHGGKAVDPVAESTAVLLDTVAEDIETAVEDLKPEEPEAPVPLEQTDELLEKAAEVVEEAVKLPPTPGDFAEELVEPLPVQYPVTVAEISDTPFYKNTKFQVAAVALGLGVLWYTYRGK